MEQQEIKQDDNSAADGQPTISNNSALEPSDKVKAPDPLLAFVATLDSLLSEEIRYKLLRITKDGLFIDEKAYDGLVSTYIKWSHSLQNNANLLGSENKTLSGDSNISIIAAPQVTTPTEDYSIGSSKYKEQYQKFFRHDKTTFYLLDGKALLIGRLIKIENILSIKTTIPVFRGSLLETLDYIHMKDRIFSETDGISARFSPQGFEIEVTSRKHPLKITNAQLMDLARAMRNSPVVSRRFPAVQYSARSAIPALSEIWKKARVVHGDTKLIVPSELKDVKKSWFLIYGDLIFIQQADSQLHSVYGLRGKNLHQFLVNETEILRSRKRVGNDNFRILQRGRSLAAVKFEGDSYQLDPACFRRFLERVTASRDLPEKLNSRFVLEDVFRQLAKILEKTAWTDSIHIPRAFSTHFPHGTNYRSKNNWVFAINKQKLIVGLYDRNEPQPKFNSDNAGENFRPTRQLVGINEPRHKKPVQAAPKK